MTDMNKYLAARGKPVERVLGFRHDATFACVATSLFVEGCGMPPDDDGTVRCRFSGLPATLVKVAEQDVSGGLWLDVDKLANAWPGWMSDLILRVGEEAAREFLNEPMTLLAGDDLTDFILEHAIRAENFFVLGERDVETQALSGSHRFAFCFPLGELTLEYDAEDFADKRSLPPFAGPKGVPTTFAGRSLPPHSLEWHEAELVELLIVLTASYAAQPQLAVQLLDADFRDGQPEGHTDVDASILNVRGVALRRLSRFDEAITALDSAMEIALSIGSEELEQQVSYNLGYARLCRTMKSQFQHGTGEEGVGQYLSHFVIDETHRETWAACEVLFQRALDLDPDDKGAESQLGLCRSLQKLLDGNASFGDAKHGEGPRTPDTGARESRGREALQTKSRKPKSKSRSRQPQVNAKEGGFWMGTVAIGAFFSLVITIGLCSPGTEPVDRSASANNERETEDRTPSARDLSEQERLEQLRAFNRGAPLPTAANGPCPVEVEQPVRPRQGEVLGPHLGRAVGTGELFGTEYFDATVRNYLMLHAPYADARPRGGVPVGPLTSAPPVSAFSAGHRSYKLSLLMHEWQDPEVAPGATTWRPGAATAHVLVWDFDASRFVCSADVSASNDPALVFVVPSFDDPIQTGDDPLNRARVDLIEQLLRTAVPLLRVVETEPETEAP